MQKHIQAQSGKNKTTIKAETVVSGVVIRVVRAVVRVISCGATTNKQYVEIEISLSCKFGAPVI